MSLLNEIKHAAIDSKTDLGELLRRCKVFGASLNSKPLTDWLIWESNGYPANAPVPDYRIWPMQVKGHFAGPMGSVMNNRPIPHALIPENVRKSVPAPVKYECNNADGLGHKKVSVIISRKLFMRNRS